MCCSAMNWTLKFSLILFGFFGGWFVCLGNSKVRIGFQARILERKWSREIEKIAHVHRLVSSGEHLRSEVLKVGESGMETLAQSLSDLLSRGAVQVFVDPRSNVRLGWLVMYCEPTCGYGEGLIVAAPVSGDAYPDGGVERLLVRPDGQVTWENEIKFLKILGCSKWRLVAPFE